MATIHCYVHITHCPFDSPPSIRPFFLVSFPLDYHFYQTKRNQKRDDCAHRAVFLRFDAATAAGVAVAVCCLQISYNYL